jgi:alpha-amylase
MRRLFRGPGLSLLLALGGCGGGGGSASAPSAPPAAPAIALFAAAPGNLPAAGGLVTLNWQASNASGYTLSVQPAAGVTGMPSGTITVTTAQVGLPANDAASAQTYTFTLTASGAVGSPAATATAAVTVAASSGAPQPLASVNWPGSVIYFLMPDRFDNGDTSNDNGGPGDSEPAQPQNPMGWYGGDFQGVIDQIDAGYFSQLGATAIWMTPAYVQGPAQSGPGSNNPNGWQSFPYHGYAPWDFTHVDPHFGSTATLQNLVNDAHARRIAVVLGQIVNDAGIGYPAYQQEVNAIASGQLILDNSAQAVQTFQFHHDDPGTGQCEPYLGAYNPIWDCPLDSLPDFNSDNTAVQTMLDQATAAWLDIYGLDGMRLDAAMYVPNSFWSQYFAYLKSQSLSPFAFGEILDGRPDFVGSYTQPSVGFSGAQNYPLYFAITQSGLVPGQPAYYGYSNLAAVDYAVQQNLKDDAQPDLMINFIDNQDMPRFTSLLANNGVAASEVLARWQIAEVLSFTLPGIPMIYYGDEAGMTGTFDPYQAVANGTPADNIRQPMTLWAAAQRQAAGVQGYYAWLQMLAAVRQRQAALQTGGYVPLYVPATSAPNVYLYQRGSGATAVLVAINATGSAVSLAQISSQGAGIPVTGASAGTTTNLLGNSASPLSLTGCGSGACLNGTLPAWSAWVLALP